MILLKIIGLFLCFGLFLRFGFVVLFHGLGAAATELPRGEGWEEEDESAADDPVHYEVLSDLHGKPVELKQV